MARSGRLLVIGFASGTIPKLAVNLALVKEFSVVGVFWGAFTRGEPEEYKKI
jgi:NADPH2:quinone reductase